MQAGKIAVDFAKIAGYMRPLGCGGRVDGVGARDHDSAMMGERHLLHHLIPVSPVAGTAVAMFVAAISPAPYPENPELYIPNEDTASPMANQMRRFEQRFNRHPYRLCAL